MLKQWLKAAAVAVYRPLYPFLKQTGLARRAKHWYEATYWRDRAAAEGNLGNSHYHATYTTHLGLTDDFYAGKKVLDIGCGPRGSLEWADMTAERVGLDPLVPTYRTMGIEQHRMRYVEAPSEKIPFPDAYFDVVLSLNSFDHVDSIEQTIAEIVRVTAPGGSFFLMVEVNHPATIAEPHQLDWMIVEQFPPTMPLVAQHRYAEPPGARGVVAAMKAKIPYDSAGDPQAIGVLVAHFQKITVPSPAHKR